MPEDVPITLMIFEDSRHRYFVAHRRHINFVGLPLGNFGMGKKFAGFVLAVAMLEDFRLLERVKTPSLMMLWWNMKVLDKGKWALAHESMVYGTVAASSLLMVIYNFVDALNIFYYFLSNFSCPNDRFRYQDVKRCSFVLI